MQAISDEGDVTVWYNFIVRRTTSLFTLTYIMWTDTYTVLALSTRSPPAWLMYTPLSTINDVRIIYSDIIILQ